MNTNTIQKDICEANGYRILEVVELVDDARIIKYQVIDPDNNPVGEPYLTIYHAFLLFRTFLNKPKEVKALRKVNEIT